MTTTIKHRNPLRKKAIRLLAAFAFSAFVPFATVQAAGKGADATSFKPEVLGAKAFLEDLLIRRYTQELGTRLEKGYFTVGAELGLSELPKTVDVKPEAKPDDGPPADLLLGTLDPDELIKRYANDSEGAQRAQSFLKDYKIKAVSVSVGVKEELGPNAKSDTEKWLAARVQGEFGKIGKSTVTVVTPPVPLPKKAEPPAPPAPPKQGWERLEQFQQLAGQAALAIAILLGAIFFALLNKKATTVTGTNTNTETVKGAEGGDGKGAAKGGVAGAVAGAAELSDADAPKQRKPEEITLAIREAAEFTAKLGELMPKLGHQYERVIQSWCQAGGEDGKMKVACFAEAVGRSIGKLPLPAESVPDILKVFNTMMPSFDIVEKRDLLKKVYWDMLAAYNLGTEAFDQPFDYLPSLNVSVIENALLEQNPRLKTLVALFMPSKLREDYVRSQSKEAKLALIAQAAEMSSVPVTELKSFDEKMREKMLKKSGGDSAVPLEMSLGKLVSALSPLDEIQLLAEASAGPARAVFDSYKRSSPSLAFLGDWRDEKLQKLFAKVSTDELVAYLRVMPQFATRFLALCPPMTAELAGDELRRPDSLPDSEKNRVLGDFTQRLMNMVVKNEISLYDVFAPDAPAAAEEMRNAA
ncbi:MAG: hypothetical protein JST04_15050 [Bdellovibrionales bacterium]|nr:hypothetical protein [Bdellovibrionales bacterium]